MIVLCILVVDDEFNICDLFFMGFSFVGFQVKIVVNGVVMILVVFEEEFDLIIFDVMLFDMNGFSVIKCFCGVGFIVFILFLIVKDGIEDKIEGLNVGGDDYVMKFFSFDEIVVCVQVILCCMMQVDEELIICVGELLMDQDMYDVYVGKELIEFSLIEFKLLCYLMFNLNCVLLKVQIFDYVWEYDFNGDVGIVESYILYF